MLTQSSSSNLADAFHGEGGTTPIVSSNGQMPRTGIVWAVDRRLVVNMQGRIRLRAYDASNLSVKLFEADCGLWGNSGGGAFIEPTVINGRVYVGSDNACTVFGL